METSAMHYVRKKTINGKEYWYEQTCHRGADGKPHTSHMRYIGPADGMSRTGAMAHANALDEREIVTHRISPEEVKGSVFSKAEQKERLNVEQVVKKYNASRVSPEEVKGYAAIKPTDAQKAAVAEELTRIKNKGSLARADEDIKFKKEKGYWPWEQRERLLKEISEEKDSGAFRGRTPQIRERRRLAANKEAGLGTTLRESPDGRKASLSDAEEAKRVEDLRLLKESVKNDIAKGWKYFEFGSRLKAEKEGEPVEATKHLSDEEYEAVKPYLSPGGEPRVKAGPIAKGTESERETREKSSQEHKGRLQNESGPQEYLVTTKLENGSENTKGFETEKERDAYAIRFKSVWPESQIRTYQNPLGATPEANDIAEHNTGNTKKYGAIKPTDAQKTDVAEVLTRIRNKDEMQKKEFNDYWRKSLDKFGTGRYSDRIKWISAMMGTSEETTKRLQISSGAPAEKKEQIRSDEPDAVTKLKRRRELIVKDGGDTSVVDSGIKELEERKKYEKGIEKYSHQNEKKEEKKKGFFSFFRK